MPFDCGERSGAPTVPTATANGSAYGPGVDCPLKQGCFDCHRLPGGRAEYRIEASIDDSTQSDLAASTNAIKADLNE